MSCSCIRFHYWTDGDSELVVFFGHLCSRAATLNAADFKFKMDFRLMLCLLVTLCVCLAAADTLCGQGQHRVDDRCEACPGGTYMEQKMHSNIHCVPCKEAEAYRNQVEIHACNATHNTQIGCKPDYYLRKDDCEECSRCGVGDAETLTYQAKACSPNSNTVCCQNSSFVEENGKCELKLPVTPTHGLTPYSTSHPKTDCGPWSYWDLEKGACRECSECGQGEAKNLTYQAKPCTEHENTLCCSVATQMAVRVNGSLKCVDRGGQTLDPDTFTPTPTSAPTPTEDMAVTPGLVIDIILLILFVIVVVIKILWDRRNSQQVRNQVNDQEV